MLIVMVTQRRSGTSNDSTGKASKDPFVKNLLRRVSLDSIFRHQKAFQQRSEGQVGFYNCCTLDQAGPWRRLGLSPGEKEKHGGLV